MDTPSTSSAEQTVQIKRPTTLVLDCNRVDIAVNDDDPKDMSEKPSTRLPSQKPLFRSNSSGLHKRLSTFVPVATSSATNKFRLSSELDQIFVISSSQPSNADDDNYDSIKVIDERRMKNMPKSDRARLYKSNTFICEEYYANEQIACTIDADAKETVVEEKQE